MSCPSEISAPKSRIIPAVNPAPFKPSAGGGVGAVSISSIVRASPKMGGESSMRQISQSSSSFVGIPRGYGFVVLTAVGSVFLVFWKAMNVGQARQEHKVPYPAMYSLDNIAFNCIQRAHQNTLENYPQFLALLLIGGLEMPYFSTLGGLVWVCGRIAYAQGYYTGDPRKRSRGTFGIGGMFMVMAASLKFAVKHLR